ncbi:MAG: TB2/DP1/HVA22 family protein [Actinobacteria bacterium]|nr:TB2/DP1/HVA22 family protein [Actinomycetota bacterium]
MVDLIRQATVLTGLDKLDSHPSLQFVEAKTKVKPSFIALGIAILLLLLLAVFSLDKLVLCIAAYVVPAYFTLLTMQSQNKEGQIRYLVYWASFSVAEILNPVGTLVLGTHLWVITRVGLVVALLNPRIDGAWRIYKSAVSDQASS